MPNNVPWQNSRRAQARLRRRQIKAGIPPRPVDDKDDGDPVPVNIDEFRDELARRINRFIADRRDAWRGCPERACQRQHVCCAPKIRCSNLPPSPPATPEQYARTVAHIQRALRQVEDQRGQDE
ncbi:MAG: hypothetical protein WAM62_11445 [Pseudolabrys sp.]